MHFAWAITIAWNVRNGFLRVGLWSYAAVTAVATLALRQHYLIDLIAALPYAVAVQWAALAWDRQRIWLYRPVIVRAEKSPNRLD